MKKKLFNIIIVGISILAPIILVLNEQGANKFFSQLSTLKLGWIFLALLFMFLYWFFEAASLNVIMHFHGLKSKLSNALSYTMIGQFFNSITPFATGGQPAQVLYMTKNGIDSGSASSIVMVKFVSFQTMLTLYSLIVVILTFKNFSSNILFLLPMTILGLGIHASMIAITVLFSYNRTFTEKILKTIFRLLKKMRLIKGDPDESEKNLEQSLLKFHDNALLLKSHPKLLMKISLLTFIQLTFFFSIPFLVNRSFGFDGNYFSLLSAAVFVATVISFVPLPGSTGGAEYFYLTFYNPFFHNNTVMSAMLLWRIVTFYSCIAFGGIFTLLPSTSNKIKLKHK